MNFRSTSLILIFLLALASISYSSVRIPVPISSCQLTELIITDRSPNHNLNRYSTNFEFIAAYGSQGSLNGQFNSPHGIAEYKEKIYVVDSDNHRVQKFDLNGNYISQFGSFGSQSSQFNKPRGISIYNNYIYITDSLNHRVQKFDLNGNYISQFGSLGTNLSQFTVPWGITIYKDFIYITEEGDTFFPRVQKFDLNGTPILAFGSLGNAPGQFYQPKGIEGFNNTLFIADTGNHRIQVFDLNGSYLSEFGSFGTGLGQLDSPESIKIFNNTIYVVNAWNSKIQKFALNGSFISGVGSYGNNSYQFSYPSSISTIRETTFNRECSSSKPLICSRNKLVNNCQVCSCSCGTCFNNGDCNINANPNQTIKNITVTPSIADIGNPILISTTIAKNCAYSSNPKIYEGIIIEVVNPDGKIIKEMTLYDDGLHGDNKSDDMIYTNIFNSHEIIKPGIYTINFIGSVSWDHNILRRNNISSIEFIDVCKTIRETGPTNSNLNIVYIPCDYDNMNEFWNNTVGFTNYFMNKTPYYNHTQRMNFYLANITNLTCSHEPGENPYLNPEIVRNAANSCYTGYRKIVVLSDHNRSVGVVFGLGSDIMYVTNENPWAFYHEAGHSLPALDDEYNFFTNLQGLYPRAPNCDAINFTSGIACQKWCRGPMIQYNGSSICTTAQNQTHCLSFGQCLWLNQVDQYYNSRCVPAGGANENIATQCNQGTTCSRGCGHHYDWFKHEWPPDAMGWFESPEYGSIDVNVTNDYLENFGAETNVITNFRIKNINGNPFIEEIILNEEVFIEQDYGQEFKLQLSDGKTTIKEIPFSFQSYIIAEEFHAEKGGIKSGSAKIINLQEVIVQAKFDQAYKNIKIVDKKDKIILSESLNY